MLPANSAAPAKDLEFLNQAHAGRCAPNFLDWFVHERRHACLCVCVCLPPRLLITSGMM